MQRWKNEKIHQKFHTSVMFWLWTFFSLFINKQVEFLTKLISKVEEILQQSWLANSFRVLHFFSNIWLGIKSQIMVWANTRNNIFNKNGFVFKVTFWKILNHDSSRNELLRGRIWNTFKFIELNILTFR